MKKLVLAAGILVLAIGATPWVFGQLAAQRLTADLERLNAEAETTAELLDYARGWRTSTATIELDYPQAAIDPAELPPGIAPELAGLLNQTGEPLRLEIAMQHGPLLEGLELGLMTARTRLAPDTPGYPKLLEELDIEYLFEVRSVTAFGGTTDFVAEMPPFALMRDALLVEFSGLEAAGSYDVGTRRFDVAGSIASLQADAPTAALVLEGLTFDTDSRYFNEVLRTGTAGASLAQLNVLSAGDGPAEALEMSALEIRFDVDLDEAGERAVLTSLYRAGSISDGADVNLTNLDVTAHARDVHLGAFSAYYAAAQAAAVQADSVAPLSLAAEDALYDLLAAGPTAEVGPVSFEYNGEPFTATLRFIVDAAALPPRDAFAVLALLFGGALAIEASLELSEPLATLLATRGLEFQLRRGATEEGLELSDEDIEAIAASRAAVTLAGLVAQGLVNSDASGYSTEARFANGTLTVNGNVVPLGMP